MLPHSHPDHSLQIENLTWWTLARDVLMGAKAGACVALGSDPDPHPRESGRWGGTRCGPGAFICLSSTPHPGDGRIPQKHAFWARVCGFNAILLICVNIFFYAYFA